MTKNRIVHLIITLIGALLFLPFIGKFSLFDWDEINFAEAAREMIKSGNYSIVQIGFEPFWEKPPLFIWMQAACMKLFGINEFAARLPNAIFGIITLNYLYFIGRRIHGHFKAIFWVLVYACTLLPFIYFKTGIMDPVFNFFIFVSLVNYYLAETSAIQNLNPRIHYVLSGLFIGLAILTKGPVALVILGLIMIVRFFQSGGNAWPGLGNLFLFSLAAIGVGSSWYLYLYFHYGSEIIQQFLTYQSDLFKGQIPWHTQPFYYHVLVLLVLCFPASVIAIPSLFSKEESVSRKSDILNQYMKLLFWVVLILFSIVRTKIVHYSSLCWIPIAYFAGDALYLAFTDRKVISRKIALAGMVLSLIIGAVLVAVFLFVKYPNFRLMFPPIKDEFANSILNRSVAINNVPWIVTSITYLVMFIVFFRLFLRKKISLILPFIASLAFGYYVYLDVAPFASKMLQGDVVASYKRNSKKLNDVWGYKSYAHMFYGNQTPQQYAGLFRQPEKMENRGLTPKEGLRSFYLMNYTVKEDVFITTRIGFKPDPAFLEIMKPYYLAVPYQVWKKK